MNANAIPFSASSFSRRGLGAAQSEFVPDAAKTSQQAPQQQVHNPSQESNPLSRLTEEQREEINEAVGLSFRHPIRPVPPVHCKC